MTLADTYAEDAAQSLRDSRLNVAAMNLPRPTGEIVALTAQAQATQAVASALLAINETLKDRSQ